MIDPVAIGRASTDVTTRSTSIAPPCPPPMQIAAMPRRPPLRSSTFSTMQHDPRSRRADRMPERDRAAVDVERSARRSLPSAPGEPELVAAEIVALPRAQAGDHLRGERLVDLPGVDDRPARGRCASGAAWPRARDRAPSARDRAPPIAVSTMRPRGFSPCLRTALVGGEHDPRRAVGHLRAVARGDVAVLAVEERLQLREVLRRRILAHAVVGGIDASRRGRRARRSRRAKRPSRCAARTRWWLRAEYASISRARDAETPGEVFGSLAHQQADDRDRSGLSSARSPARGSAGGTARAAPRAGRAFSPRTSSKATRPSHPRTAAVRATAHRRRRRAPAPSARCA